MKTAPIVPATIAFEAGEPPRAPAFDDVYHPAGGALAQARHVFLQGNGLPARWAGRRRFVILETGFGLGNNFLATWQAWRDDPQRCALLVFVSIEKHPPRREDLPRAHAASPLAARAADLVAAWPPLTPNLHVLDFDGGRVRLLLSLGEVADWASALQLQANAFFLDGFAPARNPAMWDERLIRALARLAAPGATAATWSAARSLRDALAASGFEVRLAPGFDRKRQMTEARYAPRFTPRRAPGRGAADIGNAAESPAADTDDRASQRTALVLGAGLAGASAADALARMGWRCTVVERHAAPACEASGNPGGLFHGTAHVEDARHARFNRAAALLAAGRYARWIAAGQVPGRCDGLIRLRNADALPPLPTDYVHALEGAALRDAAGLELPETAGWFYRGGGWIAPPVLVQRLLDQPSITLKTGVEVAAADHRDGRWHLLDAAGATIAAASVLVLAQGTAPLPHGIVAEPWPLQAQRGQVSWFASGRGPQRPLAGHGYALSLPDGRLLCGATNQLDDDDPAVRAEDHRFNLQRLAALSGLQPDPGAALGGRVGWRAVAADRLPIVGAVPRARADIAAGTRLDQARLVPRIPGLFVIGGLASRGLTWAPLAAEVLAAWIDGAPIPLEADLLDAIDPARWLVRAVRRSAA